MARKKTKTGGRLLLRWGVALVSVAVVVTALVAALNQWHPLVMPVWESGTPSAPQQNPYAPTDFVRGEDGFLTCLTGESIPGIDVSSHQGVIDWVAVKESGVEFAFIRLGYRGYNSGTIHEDEKAKQNLAGAKAAGLKIGAYFFSQAVSPAEAVQEARFALQVLDGTALDLPLVYDWEFVSESARTGSVIGDTLMECIHAFCAEVERGGFEPMVYFNKDLAKTKLHLEYLSRYPFWLAYYSDGLDYPYEVRFWQYSDQGTVPGIEGNVDLDLYFP